MISVIDTFPWTAQDQTGGGAIQEVLLDGQKVLYVFGNTQAGGTVVGSPAAGIFRVYKSVDSGLTWVPVASVDLGATTVMFNPATDLEERGGVTYIHALGYIAHPTEPERYNLIKLVFNTINNTLSAPLVLIEGSKLASAYGFIITRGGTRIISTAVLDPLGPDWIPQNYSTVVIELDRGDNLIYGGPPINQDNPSGTYYTGTWPAPYNTTLRGGLAMSTSFLVEDDAGQIELYTVTHSKLIDTSRPPEVYIQQQVRHRPGVWTEPESVWKFDARYIDDKLTVVAYGQKRFLTLSYYTQTPKAGLVQSALAVLGFQDPNGFHWRGITLPSTDLVSWSEPMIQVDVDNNLHLIALRHTRASVAKSFQRKGTLTVMELDEFTLLTTPLTGAFNTLMFRWLRGRLTPNDAISKWMVIGEQGEGTDGRTGGSSFFVSKRNIAPKAILKPNTISIRRGVPVEFDARDSVDPDHNILSYQWEHTLDYPGVALTPSADGKTATLLVPKSIGPKLRTFDVKVKVTETDSDDHLFDAAVSHVTLPANVAPTISFAANPIQATRNTDLTVTATINDADADTLTFSWKQVAGSPVEIKDKETLSPTFKLYRLLPKGEALKFLLTASDGVNPKVEALLVVNASAMDGSLADRRVLGRTFFKNDVRRLTIAERHTPGKWDDVDTSAIASDFFRFKFSTAVSGEERYTYISRTSVVCFAQWDTPGMFYRRRIVVPGTGFVDARHAENDVTFGLTADGRILAYQSNGTAGSSDWPDAIIPTSLAPGSFNRIECSTVSNNRRVLVVSGPAGVLLLQIHDKTFEIVGSLMLSTSTELLYGADNAIFVRFADLESLRSGRVLVGTMDPYDPQNPTASRMSYETLVDLAQRRIVGSWDVTALKSIRVWTGELLFDDGTGYMGRPTAPVITTVDFVEGHGATFFWKQERIDLIDAYEIQVREDGGEWNVLTTLGSGSILSYQYRGFAANQTYELRIRSLNRDGASPWSNVVTHIAAADGWVEAGWVHPSWVEHKTSEKWVI